ncbi:MAG TPA: CRTAC1 family protein [Thermoanaerobaculia bacterium]|nr:CRTAC1 family protein [Thermoanaerobaculia bacterium]
MPLPVVHLESCSIAALVLAASSILSAVPASRAASARAAPVGPDDWFVDVTAETGLDFVHFNGMSGRLYYVEVVGSGGALFDYDNDGDLDLYLVQGHMLGADVPPERALFPWRGEHPPGDRLYRNDLEVLPDGTRRVRFVDVTEESGIRAHGYGMGVVAGDVDNDGWVDLYVTNFGSRNELWRNRGDGTFEEVAVTRGVAEERWSVSASFVDFDGDGWLDLYVTNYLDYSFIAHKICLTERGEPDYCLPSAYRPAADRLYRNRGDGTFEDVSERAGIAAVVANGLGVASADFDGDGRVDFYVANDLMPNNLWLNQGDGTFVDDALLAGAALSADGKAEASMGIAVGDGDGDGDFDLFLTHFRREKNTYYRNDGGVWRDTSVEVGLAAPSYPYTSFGTAFLDFDGDGWLDLAVVNGAVTFPPGTDRKRQPFALDEPNQLFRNLGHGRFEDVTALAGAAFAVSEVSRGLLAGDLDNDGDIDLVITNNSGPARVLLARYGEGAAGAERAGRWLGARLLTADGRRDALGAVAILEVDGRRLVRRAQSDGSYASAGDPRVLFRWPAPRSGAPARERLRVRWVDGALEEFEVPVGAYSELRQASGRPVAADAAGGEP